MLLLEPQERAQIHAFIINKFRGDPALLGDALEQLRARAFGVPTLGVVPYVANLRIAEEDAVALEHEVKPEGEVEVDIAVVQLPHIANFDDFDALNAESGVRVRYVSDPQEIGNPQALILPGSKTTIADLQWLKQRGWEEAIVRLRQEGKQIVGVCGGYQMLGTDLVDPHGVEGEPGSRSCGLDLLPLETEFAREKQTHRVLLRLGGGEILSGYEIHTGITVLGQGVRRWGKIFERSGQAVDVEDGAVAEDGGVWGTYLHGLFTNHSFRRTWLQGVGWSGGGDDWAWEGEYDRLADAVEAAVGWANLAKLMGLK